MSLPLRIDELQTAAQAGVTVSAGAQVAVVTGGETVRTPMSTFGASGDFLQAGTGAVTRTFQDKDRDIVSVKDFGAVGDGVTDDTAAIQAGIDAIAASTQGSGRLDFPPGDYLISSLTLKQGVILYGLEAQSVPTLTKRARLVSNGTTGVMVDTPAGVTYSCGVVGLGFAGLGAGTALVGIRFRNVGRGQIRWCTFDSFADEAILVQTPSIICEITDNFGQNILLDITRAAVTGALDIDGTDHFIERNEFTTSLSAVTSASLFCVAIVVRGSNCFSISNMGEISDVGIYVSGTLNRFTNDRADLNLGHGFLVIGTSNQFSNCMGLNNSQDTTNTYDNWRFTSASGHNQITGCHALSNVAKLAKFGFNDLVTSASSKNRYVNPVSNGAGTTQYVSQTTSGSSFSFPNGTEESLTANSATPDVTGYERFITANSSTTTIANFTGGVEGQLLVISCNDSNTTIQHNGSTITLIGAGNKKLRTGVTYFFVKRGGQWIEIVDFTLGVTADVGNAAKTIQARVDEPTQIWNTVITADRAVTLSTTGAFAGAMFHIVRTAAATGAFNLNVGTGPLKALTAGQWCEVTYNGSAWLLTAFGSL